MSLRFFLPSFPKKPILVRGEGDAAFIIPRMRLRPHPTQPNPRAYRYEPASEAGSYRIWMLGVSARDFDGILSDSATLFFRMIVGCLQHPRARDFDGFLSDFATLFFRMAMGCLQYLRARGVGKSWRRARVRRWADKSAVGAINRPLLLCQASCDALELDKAVGLICSLRLVD